MAENTNVSATNETKVADETEKKQRGRSNSTRTKVAKDIDPHMIVTVRNGAMGRLVYKSKKTGEVYVWGNFGDEQDMEIGELRNARNSAKRFFIDNWFMFDEPWIVEYLGMSQYYKNAISIDDFSRLFERPLDEVISIIENMSAGQKESVAYCARNCIADGTIDSKKMITALENCLGKELADRG